MFPRPLSIASISTNATLVMCPRPQKRPKTLRKLYKDGDIRSYLDRIALTDEAITRVVVGAIVNPARPDLLLDKKETACYDIHEAAGPKLLDECKRLGMCSVGEAKITDSYKLRDCKYIIHTVGPIYNRCNREENARVLEKCYTNSLKLAVNAADEKIRKIAFPLISVDQCGFPLDEAVQAAFVAVRNFLKTEDGDKIEQVVFVARGGEQMEAFKRLIPYYFPDAT